MSDSRPVTAAGRLANAAEMLLHWTQRPDDPAYRHWFPASRADLQRELDAYRREAAAPHPGDALRILHSAPDTHTDPDGAQAAIAAAEAALAAQPTPPAGLDVERLVRLIENEGVVQWGDDGQRSRFIENAQLLLASPPEQESSDAE